MKVVHFVYEGRFHSRTVPCGTTTTADVVTTDLITGVTCARCKRSPAFRIRKNMLDYATRTTHARNK